MPSVIGAFGLFWTEPSLLRHRISSKYEPIQPFLLRALAETLGLDTFFDIGANVGMYSLLFATDPERQVIAFEPADGSFAELQKNVAANRFTNIHSFKVALSDKVGSGEFLISGDLSGINGLAETLFHSSHNYRAAASVELSTLDHALLVGLWESGESRGFCAKIDVEGHEPEVIRGSREIFCGKSGLIQVENYGGRNSEISSLLSGYGYRKIFQAGPDDYWTNIVYVPPDTLLDCLSSACDDLIRENKGVFTAISGGPSIEVSTRVSSEKVFLSASASASLGQNLEFACYLLEDGKVFQKLPYRDDPHWEFATSDFAVGRWQARVFVRDKSEHLRKLAKTVELR